MSPRIYERTGSYPEIPVHCPRCDDILNEDYLEDLLCDKVPGMYEAYCVNCDDMVPIRLRIQIEVI